MTLLRRPPGPTVLVTAAHCTFLCKSDDIVVPNCCCDNVAQTKCTDDRDKCGDNPRVVEMTGHDVEVICGEWEIGNIPREKSGEKYNLVLAIEEIRRHPGFKIDQNVLRTNYLQDDLAAIMVKVYDMMNTGYVRCTLYTMSSYSLLQVTDEAAKSFLKRRINPTCLPPDGNNRDGHQAKKGIYSGWSNPPPFHYVQSNSPLAAPYYRDFSKQWHYKMDIVQCKDPTFPFNISLILEDPNTDTFYPPGTICAKEVNNQVCPTSGESGSPLMTQENDGFKKITTEGILSFIKGCGVYAFGRYQTFAGPELLLVLNASVNTELNTLTQGSENPLVYTKLNCYLPWIAEQYDLEYDQNEDLDAECTTGSGNETPDDEKICRNTPTTFREYVFGFGLPCIFPYYLDGKLVNDTCSKFNEDTFLDPVSRCPIWNVTTKINGISSYNSSDPRLIYGGYCLDLEGLGDLSEILDDFLEELADSTRSPTRDHLNMNPEIQNCNIALRFTPFSKCQNNCRGGRYMINNNNNKINIYCLILRF